jgi:hypothetical protein
VSATAGGQDLPPPPSQRRTNGRRIVRIWVAVGATLVIGIGALIAVAWPTIHRTIEVCNRTDALLRAAEGRPDHAAEMPSRLDVLLPTSIGPSYRAAGEEHVADARQVGRERGEEWSEELLRDRFVGGYRRWWQAPTGHIVIVQVFDFETHEGALAFQRWIVYASCTSSDEAFALAAVPGGIGQHIGWSNGDESDQISFVRGTRRYLVGVRGATSPPRVTLVHAVDAAMRTAR